MVECLPRQLRSQKHETSSTSKPRSPIFERVPSLSNFGSATDDLIEPCCREPHEPASGCFQCLQSTGVGQIGPKLRHGRGEGDRRTCNEGADKSA